MWSAAREIAAGDLVIVWLTRDALQPLLITPGKDFNSKYGNYRQSDFVGIPYGSKVASRRGKGFIHLLRPTPELWTMALPHRTQILYLADIAFITSWLDIRPGSLVIEAGTGSGSFSHSIARTIGPAGHLWSYEFHEARVAKAREEFTRHGMSDTVTLTHRNVCKDGFTVSDHVDSVFLDLPAPWDAIKHAKHALRKDRMTRICCFSPCMEQVLRTVNALNDTGFTEITMYETLLKPHEVSTIPPLQAVGEVAAKLNRSERRREEKRQQQIAGFVSAKHVPEDLGVKRKRGEVTPDDVAIPEGHVDKRVRLPETPQSSGSGTPEGAGPSAPPSEPHQVPITIDGSPTLRSTPAKITASKGMPEIRGHTSYLTFACLLPALASATRTTVQSPHPDPTPSEPVA